MYRLKVITILGLVAIAASQDEPCSDFFIPEFKTNWIGAVEYCNRIEMRLAVVDSESKHREIIRIAEASKVFNPTRTDIWIGANDLAKEGQFMWHAIGMEVGFTQWKAGEPNNAGQEHCVHMWYEPVQKFYWGWNDKYCGEIFNFVCEVY